MGALALPTGVGYTAVIAAYARAQEARQHNPFFVDPLAERFVAAATGLAAEADVPRLGPVRTDDDSVVWNFLSALFRGRTPFFDQHIKQHVDSGVRQVMVLGAGLDTRAYRMDLPPRTNWYEIDTPEVLEFKATVLAGEQPAVRRVKVPVDLRAGWADALLAAGFDQGARTVWLLEGLLMYFDTASADALLATISSVSVPGSALLTETFFRIPVMANMLDLAAEDEAVTRLFLNAFHPPVRREVSDWVSAHRWRLDQQTTLAEELARQNRPLPAILRRAAADPFGTVLAESTKLPA